MIGFGTEQTFEANLRRRVAKKDFCEQPNKTNLDFSDPGNAVYRLTD